MVSFIFDKEARDFDAFIDSCQNEVYHFRLVIKLDNTLLNSAFKQQPEVAWHDLSQNSYHTNLQLDAFQNKAVNV